MSAKSKKASRGGIGGTTPASLSGPAFPSNKWWGAGLVAIAALLMYANTLGHGFVLDDTLMITQNTFTKEGVSGIPKILSNDAMTGFFGEQKNVLPGGRYRPLSQVMFAVEYELFGLKPFPGHLINVLLYALAAMVLFLLLRKLMVQVSGDGWQQVLPLAVALLFVVHPLHTEVVANIKGRDEILALWAFIGLTWFALLYHESGSKLHLLWMLPIAFLGLLSKESAITYLVAVPLTLYFFRGSNLKQLLMMAAPIILGIIFYFTLRISLFGPVKVGSVDNEILNNPFIGATVIERIATVFMTWWKYFTLLLVPYPLTHDYYPHHFRLVDFSDYRALMGLAVSALLIVYALIRLGRRSPWSWAILFFFTVFSIYSNLLINIGAFMNERFVFLALLGFVFALALGIRFLSVRISRERPSAAWWALLAVVVVAYMAIGISRNAVWKSNYTLFTTDVQVSKNSAKCNVSAGEALINEAHGIDNEMKRMSLLGKAERYLQKGAELHPTYYGAYDKLGLAYVYMERWTEAVESYRRCLLLRPQSPLVLQNLRYIGDQCLRKEQYEGLRHSMRLLLDYAPGDTLGNYGMGVAFLKTGVADSAFPYLNKTVELAPRYADAWNKLAEAEGRFRSDLPASEKYLGIAYSLDSTNASVLENLGVLAGMRNRPDLALQWFLKAYEKNPGSDNLIINIATSYRALGKEAEAREFEKLRVK